MIQNRTQRHRNEGRIGECRGRGGDPWFRQWKRVGYMEERDNESLKESNEENELRPRSTIKRNQERHTEKKVALDN